MTSQFIPEQLITNLNGTRMDWHSVVQAFGVRRSPGPCAFNPSWNGYQCLNTPMEMFVAESLDPDSETRRVAPTAVSSSGFSDILNGYGALVWFADCC